MEGCYVLAENSIDLGIKYSALGITQEATPYERVVALNTWLENNALTCYCILAEPIVTETDVQYDVVMNYPNTTIVNDAGAYMEVEYVADTKKYIDKKFEELAVAIVSQ